MRLGFWSGKKYFLNKMTLKELVAAYFQYYAISAYIVIGLASAWVGFKYATALVPNILAVLFAVLLYPLVWYVLHRWVLHSRALFKSPLTARVWKRIHYDHHQDPHDLGVLFGALYTTLPTIFLVTAPVGWVLDGLGGAGSALASGLFMTCFYEFSHCIQHLSYKPKNKWLAKIKQRHLEHHFQDETGNFGITSFFWDKLLGTFYERGERKVKSPTVFNLGYTGPEALKYPWVADLSGGLGPDNPRDRRRAEGSRPRD